MEKIDFVITWVDSANPEWVEEKKKYEKIELCDSIVLDDANADCRYRNYSLLRYWFRSIEKFAPWVNRVHFVTCGQKPDWLNENHPKLNLVNHEDYIPHQYLPTFNSNTIEMNLHRIEELTERFVIFNDDVFLLQPIEPEFFFKHGLPVLDTDLEYTHRVGFNNWSRVIFNNYCVVNKSFDIKQSISKNWNKWFNIRELGWKRASKNLLCYLANHSLPVSTYGHIAFPHLKSTLQEIWDRYPDILELTSRHRFRSDDMVNQWLLCAWNQAKGQFYPARRQHLGQNIAISPKKITRICGLIRAEAIPQICINDTPKNTNYETCTNEIVAAFETILPSKSKYEKS